MSDSIHGHDVIDLLREEVMSLEQLQQRVISRYGESARFHTCKLQGLTLEQLLSFLLEKGKIVATEQGLSLNLAKLCQH